MIAESSADSLSANHPIRIALVAGEVSGDILGAGLIKALKRKLPDAEFIGIGGPRMIEQGLESIYNMDDLTVLGIFEVFGKLFRILGIRAGLYRRLTKNPPDVFIGIDAPDFNLALESKLRNAGITCIHYVSPTVWAWRRYRLKKIKKAVDHMLALLPFEEDFYKGQGIPVTCVGHPMAEEIPLEPDTMSARAHLDLPDDKVIIALLPGSRKSELERHSELFVNTVKWIHNRNSKLHYVVAPVDQAARKRFEAAITKCNAKALPIDIISGKAREIMTASDMVILASGTAALEAALLKKPMVITYKVSFPTYILVKWLSYVKYYSMPNNLAGKELVPELMQYRATPENIGRAVEKILSSPEKKFSLVEALTEMHKDLKRDGDERAAAVVVSYLERSRT